MAVLSLVMLRISGLLMVGEPEVKMGLCQPVTSGARKVSSRPIRRVRVIVCWFSVLGTMILVEAFRKGLQR